MHSKDAYLIEDFLFARAGEIAWRDQVVLPVLEGKGSFKLSRQKRGGYFDISLDKISQACVFKFSPQLLTEGFPFGVLSLRRLRSDQALHQSVEDLFGFILYLRGPWGS